MASFGAPDPSEPPITATMNRSGSIPSRSRAVRLGASEARSTSRIAWRTGAPVIAARGNGEFSKATAQAAADRADRRLARPGVRSYDTTTTGITSRRAAKTAGVLA